MMLATAIIGFDGADWEHMAGWGWPMMIVGWAMMAILVGLVVWTLIANNRPRSANQAIGLLDERYARGEIDRDEYVERKRDLSQ